MQPDFSHLYRAIGVRPECSLDAFRQAFRRHVASRHPDRTAAAAPGADGAQPLAEINALYELAMRFHRRHGRLPGAAPASVTPADGSSEVPAAPREPLRAAVARPGAAAATRRPDGAETAPASPRRGGRWLVIAGLLVVTLGLWRAPSPPTHATGAGAAADAQAAQDALPAHLALGMRADTVRAIQGEPLHRRGAEWDYGPSWLRFEHGRLADWYSSPLNRLKTTTASPQADAPSPAAPIPE